MRSRSVVRAPRPIEPANEFAADVVAGLTAKPKYLPPKYFYDLAGSGLFDRITQLPEYYPTRSELGLLTKHAPEIASLFPPASALVEFGSGSSRKARILPGWRGGSCVVVGATTTKECDGWRNHYKRARGRGTAWPVW